ncbi:MAG: hypothetical protein JGK24_10010 [Microcoleus sp. PH2017_29_MFU_D_A]|uniref:hypothetical protein n=1 Tax=unclassified Microcoleus TaxID=2642155 RepID=UPI001DD48CA5|nr:MULTISPECIES: hypothetical protein [unclassified Microcoleus]MCC3510824.1 hypothetical protein [Microcoleus sp. PH2017_17_BER_D_A]TAE71305.1 MAG: hypothetical protein EAZ86_04840 [Oscillatoriales cyanobacterium]MCC3423849.1 hypothetical protein [Microcoleus sp. PH2017_01_SCD_O_A]MCC3453352.1 hypothetical protein [Microcoleus sp. PH2017_08_TRC_O_A]MCC3471119.1 hypothetical protein [Microcoleus sp. PH2017_13_LAR_U_A]
MTGKQYHESIDQATTFENALASALNVVNPMVFSHNNQLISLIFNEVEYIDKNFQEGEIKICTFESFYTAVLLLHSNLILFSDFTNKDNIFTEKASKIHFKIINEIINLEREVATSGHYDFKEKDKYLNIWKKLLKNIVYLCSEYSRNRNASQNNVRNQGFWSKPRHLPKFSLEWFKSLHFPSVSIKRERDLATEDDTSNHPQSSPSKNKSGVSRQMTHIAIAIIVFVIGITLALTVFR